MPGYANLTRITTIICLLAFATGVGFYSAQQYTNKNTATISGLLWPNPKQLRAFTAIDQTGSIFNLDRLRGKWSFLFFGYTHCPDVCPVTLSILGQVYKRLQEHGQQTNVQIIFVSVDPQRDTPRQLHDYVRYFNEEMIGLGGTPEQIQDLAGQIGIVYMRGEELIDGNYLVDHTASVFLTDPQARLITIYSAPHNVDSILSRFEQIKTFINNQKGSNLSIYTEI